MTPERRKDAPFLHTIEVFFTYGSSFWLTLGELYAKNAKFNLQTGGNRK